MCATCGCGTKVANQDNNFGTVEPYGIGGQPMGSKPTTLKGDKK